MQWITRLLRRTPQYLQIAGDLRTVIRCLLMPIVSAYEWQQKTR